MQEFTTSIEIYHPRRKYEFPINHILHNSPRQPPPPQKKLPQLTVREGEKKAENGRKKSKI